MRSQLTWRNQGMSEAKSGRLEELIYLRINGRVVTLGQREIDSVSWIANNLVLPTHPHTREACPPGRPATRAAIRRERCVAESLSPICEPRCKLCRSTTLDCGV